MKPIYKIEIDVEALLNMDTELRLGMIASLKSKIDSIFSEALLTDKPTYTLQTGIGAGQVYGTKKE